MLSTTKSKPPSQSTMPNARYNRKNAALCVGINPSRRPAAQILAALTGDTAMKIPNTMATAPMIKSIGTAVQTVKFSRS